MLSSATTTQLLKEAQNGDRQALDEFLPLVYDELKRLAAWQLQRERPNHTLQPTALVHEAYLRLIDQHSVDWQNRAHFFGLAAEMMRRILVNHALSRQAAKRGGLATHLALDEALEVVAQNNIDILSLNEALERLQSFDQTQARIVELKFFAGLSIEEIAAVLGVSTATIKREWRTAKAWLFQQMGQQARQTDATDKTN